MTSHPPFELTAADLAPVEPSELDVTAERDRLVELMLASGSPQLERMAARMMQCGLYRFALARMGDGGELAEGRSLVLGCKLRVCPACNALRRARFDRQLRPQILACQELGHPVVFFTGTRHPIYGQAMRDAFDDMRGAFGAMRYGRRKRQRWQGMVAGGMYGLEQTLYGRYPKGHARAGELRVLEDGSLDRRVHAHVHAVLILQRNADPQAACARLIDWWLEECQAAGWHALPQAQNAQVVSRERLLDDRDPASYCVKYIGKPGDILTPDDALEVLAGCRSLHQVQTFGCLHGAALFADRARAAGQLEIPLDKPAEQADQVYLPVAPSHVETLAEHKRQSDAHEAALSDAELAVRDQSEDAAHPHRASARSAEWLAELNGSQDWRVRTAVWAGAAQARGDELRAQLLKRRAKRAAKAERTVARRQRWLARTTDWAEQRCDDASRQRKRAVRAERAAEALERAERYRDRCRAMAARSVPDDAGARAAVLALRAEQQLRRAEWRVVVRDDVSPAQMRTARAATAGKECERFGNVGRCDARAARLRRAARVAIDAAREQAMPPQAHNRLALIVREARRRLAGKRGERPPVNAAAVLTAGVERAAELAESAARAERCAPVPASTLKIAAAQGCPRARRFAELVAEGDRQQQERAAQRRAERMRAARGRRGGRHGDVQRVRAGVRHAERAERAQGTLPGLEGERRAS